jgi:CRISPR-associated endonuclease/helicase Cas3
VAKRKTAARRASRTPASPSAATPIDASLGQVLKTLIDRPDLADCPKVREAFPFDPGQIPQVRDLLNLFDTTPDLSGADVDIGPFIRDGEDLDVLVFWRDDQSGLGPGEIWKTGRRAGCPFKKLLPDRKELCPVAAWRFREFFAGLSEGNRERVWFRDWRKGWVKSDDADRIYPGQMFLLHREVGGYHEELGWTGDTSSKPLTCPPPETASDDSRTSGDESLDNEENSIAGWLSIHDHSVDVSRELESILNDRRIAEAVSAAGLIGALRYAPPWHDAGKAHDKFLAKIRAEERSKWNAPSNGDYPAKAPREAWKSFFHDNEDSQESDRRFIRRSGFRHELASTLALLELLRLARPEHPALSIADDLRAVVGGAERSPKNEDREAASAALGPMGDLDRPGFNLLLYLIASHHGKVRLGLRSNEYDYDPDQRDPVPGSVLKPVRRCQGVQDGDRMPACRLPASDAPTDFKNAVTTPELDLSLDVMEVCSARYGASWSDRMRELLNLWGPFCLGYLEALLRAADQRASANPSAGSQGGA